MAADSASSSLAKACPRQQRSAPGSTATCCRIPKALALTVAAACALALALLPPAEALACRHK